MGTNLFYTKKKIIDIFDQIYNSNDQGKRGYPLTARGWKCENRPELTSKNIDDLKSWYEQLKEGGTVGMELQETFWSKLYGQLTDKFGISWQFNFEE